MQTEPTTFFSDGLRLSGAFFAPDGDDGAGAAPLVIPCSGFTGLMAIHPARFARSLTAAGFRCFAFDYRGFAESEGQRGRVLLEEQVRDIVHAAAYASEDARVRSDRLVLLGWGMGGGLVLEAARLLDGVVGIAAVNGFYDGRRVQAAHRSPERMAAFLDEVRVERAERARTGEARFVDPFEIYPLDPKSEAYVQQTLKTFEHYESDSYSFELADSLLKWRPEDRAPRMTTELLIAHGDRNELHPTGEAESLHEVYAGPKELFWIEGAGHTEFMHDDDERYKALAAKVVEFVGRVTADG